jgi:hypothetical protein
MFLIADTYVIPYLMLRKEKFMQDSLMKKAFSNLLANIKKEH